MGAASIRRKELLGHREAVHVGQLDVEEHEIRAEPLDRLEGRAPVFGLADDLEPVGEKQSLDRRTKARMVVDDQDPGGHGHPYQDGGKLVNEPEYG